jgi:predicted ferric reductase
MKPYKLITFSLIILILLPVFIGIYSSQYLFTFESKIANLTGYVGAILMILGFVIGNRQIVKWFSSDLNWFLGVHKWLGIVGGLIAMAHPVLQMFVFLRSISFIFLPTFINQFEIGVTYGRFALYLLVAIWISSSVLRGKIAYRPWSYIHLVSYPLVAFVWIHAWQIGSVLNEFVWMQFYWGIAGIVFASIVMLRILQLFNFGYKKYELTAINHLPNNVTEIEVTPVNDFFVPKIGQFMYIKLKLFGESHPFTAMMFDEKTGKIVFGIKSMGKFSKSIEQLQVGVEVLLDGPYGVFTNEGQNNHPKVIVAGGVGITPFVKLVEQYGNEETIMFNCNRKLDCVIYRDKFKELLNTNYHDIISDEVVSGTNVHSSLIVPDIIKKNIPSEMISKANYFICGPVGFMNSVVGMLKSIGISQDQIFLEKFSH